MGATSSWRGALEVAGTSVNVALYPRVTSPESFKTLGTDGKPVKQVYVESGEYAKLADDPHAKVETIGRTDTRKGVEVAKGEFVALTEDQVESIGTADRTTLAAASGYAPRDSIPFDLAQKTMRVTPDSKVPGAEGNYNVVWNGLLDKGIAYLTEVTMRSGSRDSILVVYAEPDGLYAVTIPFDADLAEAHEVNVTPDPAAVAAFSGYLDAEVEVAPFDHAAFVSGYRERREAAIAAAVEGKVPDSPNLPGPEAQSGGDLLANLTAAVEAEGKAKGKAKAKPRAKKSAKAKVSS